jgi:hypothetical protein
VQPARPGGRAAQEPGPARDGRGKSKGALSGAAETISDAFKQARDEGEAQPKQRPRKSTSARRKEEQE